MSLTASPVIRSLRHSGKCPPSILLNWKSNDTFGEALSRLVELGPGGPTLRQDPSTVGQVMQLVKMASDKSLNKRTLEQRRGVLIAVFRTTSTNNKTLKAVVEQGLLVTMKSWLNQLLQYDIGGMDLLLHLLDCLYSLPVSKDQIVLSGIGKAILILEKHKICVGGRNETSIKTRTSKLKQKWMLPSNLSKYSNKAADLTETNPNSSKKRSTLSSLIDSSDTRVAKKVKTSSDSNRNKKFSFSSLVGTVDRKNEDLKKKKATTSTSETASRKLSTNNNISAAEAARLKAQQRIQKEKERFASKTPKNNINIITEEEEPSSVQDPASDDLQSAKTIRWADEVGLKIAVPFKSQYSEEEMYQLSLKSDKHKMSLSDRRKRDIMREKEMMNNAKKNHDDEDTMLVPTIPWRAPTALPAHPALANVQVVSNEVTTQNNRIASIPSVSYKSAEEVPNDPKEQSDLEKALDTAAMISTATATILFISTPPSQQANTYTAPQFQLPNNTAVPPPASIDYLNTQTYQAPGTLFPPPPPPTATPTAALQEASLDYIKSQGLPQFLVGSNVQTLQTITSTPGLIDSYSNNPNSLANLVKNLSAPPTTNNNTQYSAYNATQVAPPPLPPPISNNQMHKKHASSRINSNGFRGDSNSEANLHLSGYGPTTSEADIRALFSPYVEVLEVVMKNGFSFVNTASTEGARHAREALRGTMLSGRPIRINSASKKAFQPDKKPSQRNDMTQSSYGPSMTGNVDNIRDERGNPATKNLFVAGFGPSTTEKELFDLFSQQVVITGTVLKGTFAFINTSDKAAAIKVRDLLSGAIVNGGPIRINFAKESGRLGTSFDNNYSAPGVDLGTTRVS